MKFRKKSYPEQTITHPNPLIKSKNSAKKNSPDKETKDNEAGTPTDETDIAIVHQAVLLLQFLEHLEKLLYNAYEGCASSLPPAIRVSHEVISKFHKKIYLRIPW